MKQSHRLKVRSSNSVISKFNPIINPPRLKLSGALNEPSRLCEVTGFPEK